MGAGRGDEEAGTGALVKDHKRPERNSDGVGKLLAGREGGWQGGDVLLEVLRCDFGCSALF